MPINNITKDKQGRYIYTLTLATGKRVFLRSRKNETKKEFVARCVELDGAKNSDNATLLKALELYTKNANVKEATKKLTSQCINANFKNLLDKNIRDITKSDIISAINNQGKQLNKTSVRYYVGAIKKVLNFYCDYYEQQPINIFKNILKHLNYTSNSHPHRELNVEEFEQIKEACLLKNYNEVYLFVSLLWYTGLRPSEALRLTYDDITNDFIFVQHGKTENAKRKIPIAKQLKTILSTSNDKTKKLFNYDYLYFLTRKKTLISHLGWHFSYYDFRHTFATRYARAGANIKALQTVLGHSDAKITLNYYVKASDKDLSDLIKLDE